MCDFLAVELESDLRGLELVVGNEVVSGADDTCVRRDPENVKLRDRCISDICVAGNVKSYLAELALYIYHNVLIGRFIIGARLFRVKARHQLKAVEKSVAVGIRIERVSTQRDFVAVAYTVVIAVNVLRIGLGARFSFVEHTVAVLVAVRSQLRLAVSSIYLKLRDKVFREHYAVVGAYLCNCHYADYRYHQDDAQSNGKAYVPVPQPPALLAGNSLSG